jgi:hypothetical protein
MYSRKQLRGLVADASEGESSKISNNRSDLCLASRFGGNNLGGGSDVTNAALDFSAADALPADDTRNRRRAIVSCAVGNFVELFEFLIFGLFAAQIGANFFPGNDPVLSLLSASPLD